MKNITGFMPKMSQWTSGSSPIYSNGSERPHNFTLLKRWANTINNMATPFRHCVSFFENVSKFIVLSVANYATFLIFHTDMSIRNKGIYLIAKKD
jgi:hypothetical protein